MRTKLISAVLGLTLLGTSCSSEPTEVMVGVSDAAESEGRAELEEDRLDDDDPEDELPEDDAPAETQPPPPEGFILEPANALLDDIDGWTPVDEWYHEPVGFNPSPDCDELNAVLDLETWGVITRFWLRDGVEFYQHTIDVNTAEHVDETLATFSSLPFTCPTATLEQTQLTFEPGPSASRHPMVSMVVPEGVSATWLFEAETTNRFVMLERNNVVSILQLVGDQADPATLDELADLTVAHLATLAPEVPAVSETTSIPPTSKPPKATTTTTTTAPTSTSTAPTTTELVPPTPIPLIDYLVIEDRIPDWTHVETRHRDNNPSDYPSSDCVNDPIFTVIDNVPNVIREWAHTTDVESVTVNLTLREHVAYTEEAAVAEEIAAAFAAFGDRCMAELQPFPIVDGGPHAFDLPEVFAAGSAYTFRDIYHEQTGEFYGQMFLYFLSVDNLLVGIEVRYEFLGGPPSGYDTRAVVGPIEAEWLEPIADQIAETLDYSVS